MTDISELSLSGGGLTVVATDVMLADVESLASISAGLNTVLTKLAIADATMSETARSLTQVGWGRSRMDDAWAATTTAKDICDYLGGQLVIAIENYTETEHNVEWLAMGVDALAAFFFGKSLWITRDMLGPAGTILAAFLPWLVRGQFDGQKDAIGARDLEAPGWVNELASDPQTIETVRRLVMQGDLFATGLGPVPTAAAALFSREGFTGAALSSHLLLLYAAQAGMLQETNVSVTKTASYERPGPITTTVDRLGAIPVAGDRADGAQIRIDEIHDGKRVRYEVFIAGTADFNPISAGEPFDLTSNVAGVAGQSPASYRAVQLAMEQAGITEASAVSFVGHSQGGLIASMLAASGDYNTQGVTTIGAPAGQILIPPGVPALLIEHYEDLVPALGGTQANTDALIVRRHAFSDEYPPDPTLSVPGHHLQYYLQTAELIDHAESTVLQDTVAELNEFSSGDSVTSTWYAAERVA